MTKTAGYAHADWTAFRPFLTPEQIKSLKDGAIIRRSKRFPESALAHELLDGLTGLQIGGSAHNDFGLRTINVDKWPELDTVYKLQEIELCGEALPVDVVADGDALPFPDKSFDFVISSHVIEHFPDPIKALKEWARVATKYIYIICPKRDALPSDISKPLSKITDLIGVHIGTLPLPEGDEHHNRWTPNLFVMMCEYAGLKVSHIQETDDKVGNGFTIVIDLQDA